MILKEEEKPSIDEALRRFLKKNREEKTREDYNDLPKNYILSFEKEEDET